MKIIFFAFLSALIFFQMSLAQDNSPKEFSIYLLPDNIKSAQLSKINLKTLRPKGKPFIGMEDILNYQKENHEFQIDYLAAERLKKLRVPVSGKPFVVFVNDEAIYAGAFWTSISSQSFNGVVINQTKAAEYSSGNSNLDFPVISFELGYPTSKFFNGADKRSDSRILETLEKSGRLYEQLEILVSCQKISGTGKRHPSYIYNFTVDRVEKGNFKDSELQLELSNDFGGGKMQRALEALRTTDNETGWKFNKEKKILLKFIQQVGATNPDRIFKDFEVK